MHELSIAQALVEQVRRHVANGARLRRVEVRAGPMRAIEPQAMQWAWQAATSGTELEGAELALDVLPWSLRCAGCGRTWETQELDEACGCGGVAGPVGGDELELVALEVDEPKEPGRGLTD